MAADTDRHTMARRICGVTSLAEVLLMHVFPISGFVGFMHCPCGTASCNKGKFYAQIGKAGDEKRGEKGFVEIAD